VTVRLRSNVTGARFVVDGRQIAGGMLRGPKGETKKVLVEAEGYVPTEALVALDAGQDPPEIQLQPLAVAQSAGPVATAAAPTGALRNGGRPGTKPSAAPSSAPSSKPSAAPSSEAAVPPLPGTTASPAPTLTIKRE
jgi:hypothetical protein